MTLVGSQTFQLAATLHSRAAVSIRSRVGVACPIPGERAAFFNWLTSAGFTPVAINDAEAIPNHLQLGGFETLIMDADLLRPAASILRLLGANRPLIIIGDSDDVVATAEAQRRDATYLPRPVTQGLLGLSVALALAEGRPARRSRRQPVARIPATVHELPSYLIDVSYDGIRLEIAEPHRSRLPTIFRVEVPALHVGVLVQRVWMSVPPAGEPQRTIWCGVALKQNSPAAMGLWRSLVDKAVASADLGVGPAGAQASTG